MSLLNITHSLKNGCLYTSDLLKDATLKFIMSKTVTLRLEAHEWASILKLQRKKKTKCK